MIKVRRFVHFLLNNNGNHNSDILSTLKRVANVRYVIPDGLSHDAKDLINRILQKDAKKRLTLVQIRNHPFFLKRSMNSSRSSSNVC